VQAHEFTKGKGQRDVRVARAVEEKLALESELQGLRAELSTVCAHCTAVSIHIRLVRK
jgi:hypothetical protein